jgi:predicted adenylyl cyclase CyaB
MREIELKAVVDDLRTRRRAIESAGGVLVFAGRLEDRRYDTSDRALAAKDIVLRLRVYRNADGDSAYLDWKGPTEQLDGFKVRDELSTGVSDANTLATILSGVGYVVTREIEREIIQYDLGGTIVRFERYPRMDTLVEVEGTQEGIEAAIKALEMSRESFTAERLPDFVRAYESRTGVRAALCAIELSGKYPYSVRDA